MTLGLVSLQEGLRLTQRATTRRRRGLGGVPGTTVPQGGHREPALFDTNVGRDHPPPLPHGHGPQRGECLAVWAGAGFPLSSEEGDQ